MAPPNPLTLLSKLKPRDFQAVICVRIIRKWNFTGKYENGPILHVDLVLADAEGNLMYAEIPRNEVETKSPLLEPGKIYIIDRFKVKAAKSSYMPVTGQSMIEFTCYTRVQLADNPPDTFPVYVQTVVPFDQIRRHAKEDPDFIDVIGVVAKIHPSAAMRLPGRPDVTITTDVIIKDLHDRELRVMLWGQRGKDLNVQELYDEANPRAIVVLFVGCVPKEFQKVVYVTGNNACHWYFNPPIAEAQPFYAKFKDRHYPIDLPAAVPPESEEVDQPIIIEHKSLEELNQLGPYAFPTSGSHCTVQITSVPEDNSWWYLGCTLCKKSSSEQVGGGPWCKTCETADFRPRYKLSFMATDTTTEARFFAFDVLARQIVKKNCQALVHSTHKGPGAHPALAAIVSNRFTFAIGLTSESYHSTTTRTYLVNGIVKDFQRQLAATDLVTLQASTQPLALPAPALISPGGQNTPPTPSTSSYTTPPPSTASPAPAQPMTALPDPQTTPPTVEQLPVTTVPGQVVAQAGTADISSTQDSADMDKSPTHSKDKDVKRKLFDHPSTDEKEAGDHCAHPPQQGPPGSETITNKGKAKNGQDIQPKELLDSRPKRSRVQETKPTNKSSGRQGSSS